MSSRYIPPYEGGGADGITEGDYTGDGNTNRAIEHKLDKLPNMITISITSEGSYYRMITLGQIDWMTSDARSDHPVTEWTDTYFYVGNNPDVNRTANETGKSYHWVAF